MEFVNKTKRLYAGHQVVMKRANSRWFWQLRGVKTGAGGSGWVAMGSKQ